jgi:putative chitinase
MITLAILQKVCPKTKSEILSRYVEPLNNIGKKYDMLANKKRISSFVAQIAHESGGFNFVSENLNYSTDGLQKIFKKYFPTPELAAQYARKPEMIANRVYASRMGNGDERSGDGFRFRGRGLIQLTGKENYTNFAKAINKSLEETVKYLETPEGAVDSAGWFWNSRKLNEFADKDDFVGMTKRINGGTIGLEDRKHHYQLVMEALK